MMNREIVTTAIDVYTNILRRSAGRAASTSGLKNKKTKSEIGVCPTTKLPKGWSSGREKRRKREREKEREREREKERKRERIERRTSQIQ